MELKKPLCLLLTFLMACATWAPGGGTTGVDVFERPFDLKSDPTMTNLALETAATRTPKVVKKGDIQYDSYHNGILKGCDSVTVIKEWKGFIPALKDQVDFLICSGVISKAAYKPVEYPDPAELDRCIHEAVEFTRVAGDNVVVDCGRYLVAVNLADPQGRRCQYRVRVMSGIHLIRQELVDRCHTPAGRRR